MLWTLIICLTIVAALYATVGHGGASGYIAVMALFSYTAIYIRQDALILNIVVSAIAFLNFYRKGFFNWKLFLPLVVTSIPMAFLGGTIHLELENYKLILGIILLIPGLLFLLNLKISNSEIREMPIVLSLTIGLVLGFISGLTGIGGGVFLSPILVLGAWANQKTTAAISAPFILVNSIAGLAGTWSPQNVFDENLLWFAVATIVGGILGSAFGAGKVNQVVMKRILGIVLVIAAFKLILT